jgi:hypothetical protein
MRKLLATCDVPFDDLIPLAARLEQDLGELAYGTGSAGP